jgi:hypothetical protein
MKLTEHHQAVFMQRTDQLYQRQWQQARAAGQTLDYPLGDLRHFVLEARGKGEW